MSFLEHRVPELLDEIVGMYRAADRPLARLTDDELDVSFVDTVQAYIADPRTPARFRAVNDVAAEYVLRRRNAPVEQAVRLKEEAPLKKINLGRKLVAFIDIPTYENHLPLVVLAFGRFAVIPAVGAILTPEGSDDDPPSWDKLTGPELERAKERSRKWRDERHAEFEWLLLGRSQGRAERAVSLNDARARRASG